MRRKKVEKNQKLKLTEKNAARVLRLCVDRSCRGAVELYFSVDPEAPLPPKSDPYCLRCKYGGPHDFLMYSRAVVRDGHLVGKANDEHVPQTLPSAEISVPIVAIRGKVLVTWYEWA